MKKKLVILGAAESGVGAAILACQQGYDVFVSDGGNIKDQYRNELISHNIAFEEGKHSEEKVLNADEVVKRMS
jgi:UDP-N-acetylmuramoylalanine--D-glutamate ligase